MKQKSNDNVVLLPEEIVEEKLSTGLTIHSLPDPFSGEIRSYWQKDGLIFELHAIHDDDDYTTLCIGNNILANSSLHVATMVDPLFWLVYFAERNDRAATTWQPLEQLLQNLCAESNESTDYYTLLSSCIDKTQYQHIFATLIMDDGDDVYYKFSWDITLQWLQQKQQQVASLLRGRRQDQEKNDAGGAFVQGFVLGGGEENSINKEAEENDTCLATKNNHEDLVASYQLVGNYLSMGARERWGAQSGLSNDQLWGTAKESPNKRPKVHVEADWNVATGSNDDKEAKKEKVKPVTLGAKRLQKISKKGMQKMSSFFGVKKKQPPVKK